MKSWSYVNLSEAVSSKGSNLSLKKIRADEGDFDVFGAKGFVGKFDEYGVDVEYLSIIKDGAGVGRIKKQPAKSSVLATMQYLIPKKNFHIDFVKYFLNSIDFKSYISGSTIPHIYFKDYKEEKIPDLPINEQKAIVAKLDQVFKAIDQAKANVEQNLANAEDLFQSQLNQIFSQTGEKWEEKRLGEVCVLQRGFDLPKRLRKKGNIPLVSSSGIIDKHSESKVKKNGVVTGRSGSIGSVFFLEKDFWPLNTTLYIKDFHGNNPKYIFYLLRNFDLKKYASGSGVPTLNRNFVHSEPVKTQTDKKEQIKIIDLLDKLELQTFSLKQKYHQKLEYLEELKQSILEKAFKGELV
ncbi:MAG: restriction endonuclease subunit S [Psychroflexus halocasei]